MEEIIRTVCQGSHSECGVLVHLENGRVTRIEGDPQHPMNRGSTCIKGRRYADYTYHPDRLKYPLKRAGGKGEAKWQRVSWESALDEIADRLSKNRDKYGAETFATLHGTGPRPSILSSILLTYALGSPNAVSTDTHICFVPSLIAEKATMGESVMQETGPDYRNANCIVVWGGNPEASHPPRGYEVIEAKTKRNAKLIVVDPRRIPLAERADLWLQVRPGTDAALALGMMNVIITEGLYDREFVGKWCYGFDKLQEHVRQYTPEKIAEITWVPADKIKQAARMYATTKPAVMHHRVAIEHNVNSAQANRSLSILIALTGNVDVKGGNLFEVKPQGFMSAPHRRFKPDLDVVAKRIGAKEYPLASGPDALGTPFVVAPLWVEAMLTSKPYPIKSMYVAGGNPVLNCQETKKVWQGMKNLDLLFVTDFFMTPTAELADYVLPATTWLERDETCDLMYAGFVSARQKVIEPLYECWDDLKIVIELVKRLPWADRRFVPWNSTDEFNDWMVKGMGITFKDLKKKGYIETPVEYKKYEKKGFNTPSGKVELYSTIFEKHGHDPLPVHKEPPLSPVSTPGLLKNFPLVLTTGARYVEFFHSEGRQIASLRKRVPNPEIEIHPDTAKKARIKEGDWVWVETPTVKGEKVKLMAKVTDGIDPRVVHARHAWWFPEKPAPEHGCFESNISVILSGGPPRGEVTGSVATRGTLCKIYKAKQ